MHQLTLLSEKTLQKQKNPLEKLDILTLHTTTAINKNTLNEFSRQKKVVSQLSYEL